MAWGRCREAGPRFGAHRGRKHFSSPVVPGRPVAQAPEAVQGRHGPVETWRRL
jgi:hypothetical protein